MSEPKQGIAAMPVTQFINYYRCPYDGSEWIDVWSCCCNDKCPNCRAEVEPYKSADAVHTPRRRG